MKWTPFSVAQPKLGDHIDILCDEVERFDCGEVCGLRAFGEWYKIDTDLYVGMMVRGRYQWRITP